MQYALKDNKRVKLKKLPKNKFARPLKCVIWHIHLTYKEQEWIKAKDVFKLGKVDSCNRKVKLADVKRLDHYKAISLLKEMDDFYWIKIYPDNFDELIDHDEELSALREVLSESMQLKSCLSIGESILAMYKKMGMVNEGYKRVARYLRKISEAGLLEKEGGKVNG